MKLVGMTQQHWETYCSWWAERGLPPPHGSHRAVMVADDEGVLLCGFMLYTTDGPYIFAEHLATNPSAGRKETHRAAEMAIRAATGIAAIESKHLLVLVSAKGIKRLLERAGYTPEHSITTYHWTP